jgi:UDP-GlcNAc3NAcA epimerase
MKLISHTGAFNKMRNTITVLSDSGMLGLFPMHPGTQKCLHEYGLMERMPGNVRLITPLGYLDMLMLMATARKILTDSGGIQKEAYMLGVPCITLRENTEWKTLEGGWNVLVGAEKDKIIEAISNLAPMGEQRNVFGNSSASERILQLVQSLNT